MNFHVTEARSPPKHVSVRRQSDILSQAWAECNLLSLDDGGTRGIWTLLALEQLIYCIAQEERNSTASAYHSFYPLPFPEHTSEGPFLYDENMDNPETWIDTRRYLPCHYFDIICGSGTGSFIAIMLGRLRMTVADCMYEYENLLRATFGNPRSITRSLFGVFRTSKNNSRVLSEVLKDTIDRRNEVTNEMGADVLFPTQSGTCRTFVIAVKKKTKPSGTLPEEVVIRSYDDTRRMGDDESPENLRRPLDQSRAETSFSRSTKTRAQLDMNPTIAAGANAWPIWKVAQAAIAIPLFFETKESIALNADSTSVIYMGASAHNPTEYGIREIETVYGPKNNGEVVSIGASQEVASLKSLRKILFGAMFGGPAPASTHRAAKRRLQTVKASYYRFDNPKTLLMEPDEWKPTRPSERKSGPRTLEEIKTNFTSWLKSPATHQQFQQCARELVKRRRDRLLDIAKWERYATVIEFQCPGEDCDRPTFIDRNDFLQHLEKRHKHENLFMGREYTGWISDCSHQWQYGVLHRKSQQSQGPFTVQTHPDPSPLGRGSQIIQHSESHSHQDVRLAENSPKHIQANSSALVDPTYMRVNSLEIEYDDSRSRADLLPKEETLTHRLADSPLHAKAILREKVPESPSEMQRDDSRSRHDLFAEEDFPTHPPADSPLRAKAIHQEEGSKSSSKRIPSNTFEPASETSPVSSDNLEGINRSKKSAELLLRLPDVRVGLEKAVMMVKGAGRPQSGELRPQEVDATITISWKVLWFLQQEFGMLETLANIFVLVGTADAPQGLTCRDYLLGRWPKIADFLLWHLKRAIQNLVKEWESSDGVRAKYSLKETAFVTASADSSPLLLHNFTWEVTLDGGVPGERALFQLHGPAQILMDFVEAIAWLTAALRPTDGRFLDFATSDAHFEIEYIAIGDYVECNGFLQPMEVTKPSQKQCWHQLFRSTVIVNSPPIQAGQRLKNFCVSNESRSDLDILEQHNSIPNSTGLGLELPFDGLNHMISLSGANVLVDYNGGLVLLGLSAILIPCRWLINQGLQWHLVKESDPDKMISLNRLDDDDIRPYQVKGVIKSAADVQVAKSHFVGLWEDAAIALGTKDYNYTAIARNQFPEVEYTKVIGSTGANIGVSHIFSSNVSRTYNYVQNRIYRKTDHEDLHTILEFLCNDPAIVYESSLRRAWLVPKLSLVLHATQLRLRFRKQGAADILAYAELQADGALAAWEVLQPSENHSSVKGFRNDKKEDEIVEKELLARILLNIASNLRKMKPYAPSGKLTKFVKGYDLADLCSDSVVKLVGTSLNFQWGRKPSNGWWLLTETVPLLLCDKLAPPVRPINTDKHFTIDLGEDQLVCPISCLGLLNDENSFRQGNVCRGVFLHSPHAPFGDCGCRECKNSGMQRSEPRVQYLVERDNRLRKWANVLDHKNATILIASHGKVLMKPRKTMQPPHPRLYAPEDPRTEPLSPEVTVSGAGGAENTWSSVDRAVPDFENRDHTTKQFTVESAMLEAADYALEGFDRDWNVEGGGINIDRTTSDYEDSHGTNLRSDDEQLEADMPGPQGFADQSSQPIEQIISSGEFVEPGIVHSERHDAELYGASGSSDASSASIDILTSATKKKGRAVSGEFTAACRESNDLESGLHDRQPEANKPLDERTTQGRRLTLPAFMVDNEDKAELEVVLSSPNQGITDRNDDRNRMDIGPVPEANIPIEVKSSFPKVDQSKQGSDKLARRYGRRLKSTKVTLKTLLKDFATKTRRRP